MAVFRPRLWVMTQDDHLPPVSLFRLFWKMGGWIVLAIGAMLLVITMAGHFTFKAAQRFAGEGLPAVAVVTEKYTTESRDSDGDRTVTRWLTLEFVTQRGRPIEVTDSVSSSEYRRAAEGQEFDLLYLRSDPTQVELTEGSNAKTARVTQIIALIVGLIWLGALWWIGRWAVEAVRARRYGAREEAHVTEVRRTNVKVNNRSRYRLIWRDADGREGQSLLHKPENLDMFSNGAPITIYQGLKRPWWAGDIGDRDGPLI